MAGLTADQIDAVVDGGLKQVEVPEWGGSVFLRVMSTEERDAHEIETLKAQMSGGEGIPPDNFRSRLLARCLCDESGALLYPGGDGMARLAKKASGIVNRLWIQAMKLNALTADEMERISGESTPDQP